MTGLISENLRIALDSIRSHLLRSILTVLIIAFGIMALVGILTSIDAIKYYLNENFTSMGANSFTIRNRSMRIHMGNRTTLPRNYRYITWQEALQFTGNYRYGQASVQTYATNTATVKYGSVKTNPNIPVIGSDENYLRVSGNELEKGRTFSAGDISNGSYVAVIGSALSSRLFKSGVDPVGKIISIGSGKYQVIGVMKAKGTGMGFNTDNTCIVPVTNVRQAFSRPKMTFTINVVVEDPSHLETALGEATGLFRVIRGVKAGEENNFDIEKSDSLAEMLFENLKYLRLAATIIGAITLIGAAIGLMNIMLVSVTERTQEIGIRKAMGATSKTIRNQFLAEAIVIGQIGGIVGIVFGIGIGNILSSIIGSGFIVPWAWIILGVLLCFGVAVASGYIPANKAARLNPVDSLRYE